MPSVDTSAGSIHYERHGHGTPMVLLHANPGDSRDFEAVIPALSQHHTVHALDWPGYGRSTLRPPAASADVGLYYQALRQFAEALGLRGAIFIGNSVGGYAAARLAIEAPHHVAGLVLVSSGGFTPRNLLTRAFCALQGSRFSLSPRRFAGLYLKRRSPAALAMLQRAATEQATAERIALNRAMWRSFGHPHSDLRATAGRICAPTLLVHGEQDPVIRADQDGRVAARTIPGATLLTLPCGHAPFAEVPELFLSAVEPFLVALRRPPDAATAAAMQR